MQQFSDVLAEVKETAQSLTDAAHAYGLTESDIEGALHGIGSGDSGTRMTVSSLVAGAPAKPSDVPGVVGTYQPGMISSALDDSAHPVSRS